MGKLADDDIEVNTICIAVAKCNVHDKHTKALFKLKELKEAEDKKAQLLKEHSKMHTEI